jgi:alkylation response protein AidB-like acyl-CoA dehydrogenase
MFGDVSDYFAVMAKHNESLKMILLSKDTEGLDIKETTSLDQTRPMCEISMSDIKIQENDIMIEPQKHQMYGKKLKIFHLVF